MGCVVESAAATTWWVGGICIQGRRSWYCQARYWALTWPLLISADVEHALGATSKALFKTLFSAGVRTAPECIPWIIASTGAMACVHATVSETSWGLVPALMTGTEVAEVFLAASGW